eukprot:246569-Rhodomonas_salina.1
MDVSDISRGRWTASEIGYGGARGAVCNADDAPAKALSLLLPVLRRPRSPCYSRPPRSLIPRLVFVSARGLRCPVLRQRVLLPGRWTANADIVVAHVSADACSMRSAGLTLPSVYQNVLGWSFLFFPLV